MSTQNRACSGRGEHAATGGADTTSSTTAAAEGVSQRATVVSVAALLRGSVDADDAEGWLQDRRDGAGISAEGQRGTSAGMRYERQDFVTALLDFVHAEARALFTRTQSNIHLEHARSGDQEQADSARARDDPAVIAEAALPPDRVRTQLLFSEEKAATTPSPRAQSKRRNGSALDEPEAWSKQDRKGFLTDSNSSQFPRLGGGGAPASAAVGSAVNWVQPRKVRLARAHAGPSRVRGLPPPPPLLRVRAEQRQGQTRQAHHAHARGRQRGWPCHGRRQPSHQGGPGPGGPCASGPWP